MYKIKKVQHSKFTTVYNSASKGSDDFEEIYLNFMIIILKKSVDININEIKININDSIDKLRSGKVNLISLNTSVNNLREDLIHLEDRKNYIITDKIIDIDFNLNGINTKKELKVFLEEFYNDMI